MVQSIPKEKRFYLILGGEDKGADWNEMFKLLSKYRVKIFAIGKNSLKVVDLANSYKLESVASETLFQAVQDISLELQPDELAVLSPASASFDQFRSYVDRGEQFKTMVKELYQTSEL
jgi:UDP-N-acetylmuramoylalanine--D-glutamate ligase